MKMKPGNMRGMTLIELMIVVVVVAILAAIAYPSYLSSVRKARRADAIAALTTMQLQQEKLRASCPFYGQNLGGAANVCGANAAASTVQVPATSPDGRYTISLAAASGVAYTATATGVGDQAGDKIQGVTCTLVLTVNQANPNGLRTPAGCWN
jgi:type IV pilus assembly protein PilE